MVKYKISINDEEIISRRFSAFEKLGKDMQNLEINIDWINFPTKYVLKPDKSKRCGKLQVFLQQLIKSVLMKDSKECQAVLGEFFSFPPVKLVHNLLLNSKPSKMIPRENSKALKKELEENEVELKRRLKKSEVE